MLELRTPHEVADWLRQRVTGQLQTDSRLVQPGDGFLAWSGASADGRLFVSLARARALRHALSKSKGCKIWIWATPLTSLAMTTSKRMPAGLPMRFMPRPVRVWI